MQYYNIVMTYVKWGERVENPSLLALFSSVFDNSWAKHRTYGRVLARLQVLQNSGSLTFMLRVKTLSAPDRH